MGAALASEAVALNGAENGERFSGNGERFSGNGERFLENGHRFQTTPPVFFARTCWRAHRARGFFEFLPSPFPCTKAFQPVFPRNDLHPSFTAAGEGWGEGKLRLARRPHPREPPLNTGVPEDWVKVKKKNDFGEWGGRPATARRAPRGGSRHSSARGNDCRGSRTPAWNGRYPAG